MLTVDRPLQREVITAALEKHDVYLQAATSFGKSICFQLPAIVDVGSESVSFPRRRPAADRDSHHRNIAATGIDGELDVQYWSPV